MYTSINQAAEGESGRKAKLTLSFIEIYNEQVFDLIDPETLAVATAAIEAQGAATGAFPYNP